MFSKDVCEIKLWESSSDKVEHCMLLVGYRYISSNPSKSYWILQNQHGPDYCDTGYVYMKMIYGDHPEDTTQRQFGSAHQPVVYFSKTGLCNRSNPSPPGPNPGPGPGPSGGSTNSKNSSTVIFIIVAAMIVVILIGLILLKNKSKPKLNSGIELNQ